MTDVVHVTQPPLVMTHIVQLAQGLAGPKGDRGDPGPEPDFNDLPDFTLIFENQLV